MFLLPSMQIFFYSTVSAAKISALLKEGPASQLQHLLLYLRGRKSCRTPSSKRDDPFPFSPPLAGYLLLTKKVPSLLFSLFISISTLLIKGNPSLWGRWDILWGGENCKWHGRLLMGCTVIRLWLLLLHMSVDKTPRSQSQGSPG